MAGTLTTIGYTSDDGSEYRYKQDASNATAAGNVAPTGGIPFLSRRTRPRYVLAKHPTSGRERRIVIGDPANALWTSDGASTITLPDFNAAMAATAFTVAGRIGERRLG